MQEKQTARLFIFTMRGVTGTDELIVAKTSDTEVIKLAREDLRRPYEERKFIISGVLGEGNDGYNLWWSWHFIPDQWELAENAMEVCDYNPKQVEEEVEQWIGKQYCPWSSILLVELP